MKKNKGKFGSFLKKVAGVFPEAIGIGAKLATGQVGAAIADVGELLKGKAEFDQEAQRFLQEYELNLKQFNLEAYELEVTDRESARDLYKNDSMIQKIFGILFLLAYGGLSWYLLFILMNNEALPQLAETMITMIWTGTSTKLNTIVDFFFGGSVK